MRFSGGLPGQSRKDKRTTSEVKVSKGLGEHSGKWIKDLWPPDALAACKTKINEARDYHNTVTLPFGVKGDDASEDSATPAIAGIGILPAALIAEYGDKMRQFKGELEKLVADFLANPQQYVDWAVQEHNGTFEPTNYPGCFEYDLTGPNDTKLVTKWVIDSDKFREVMRKKFYLRTEPLPVPDANQFTQQLHNLLGTDADSVNIRVRDAEVEAQRELIRRMIEPVKAMADKLTESPKNGKDDIVFRDTLVGNIKEIASLAPKLNIGGDTQIDAFAAEMANLGTVDAELLRTDKTVRSVAAEKAAEMVKRLSGYKF